MAMRVLLDGQEIAAVSSGAEALDLLRSWLSDQQQSVRVVQTVLLNGSEVGDWEEALRSNPEGLVEVRIETVSLKQALLETGRSALSYLPRLQEGVLAAAGSLREGREQEAGPVLSRAVEGLAWYTQLLEALAGVGVDQGGQAQVRLGTLQGWLKELVAAWEHDDYVTVADLLEYEIVPEVASGRQWLEQLMPDLERNQPGEVV